MPELEEWQDLVKKLAQPFDTMDFLPRSPNNGQALGLPCQHCDDLFRAIPSQLKQGKGKYCSRKCYFAAKSVRAADGEQIAKRFWSDVARSGPGECWEWGALRHSSGYGLFTCRGRQHRAHRIAYELAHGAVPSGLFVLHHCDNRGCVNPAHLYAGTKKQNTDDMFRRGRQGHHRRRSIAGSANPNAKLSPEDVEAIRRRFAAGGATRIGVAAEYGVSATTIGRLLSGKNWLKKQEAANA